MSLYKYKCLHINVQIKMFGAQLIINECVMFADLENCHSCNCSFNKIYWSHENITEHKQQVLLTAIIFQLIFQTFLEGLLRFPFVNYHRGENDGFLTR